MPKVVELLGADRLDLDSGHSQQRTQTSVLPAERPGVGGPYRASEPAGPWAASRIGVEPVLDAWEEMSSTVDPARTASSISSRTSAARAAVAGSVPSSAGQGVAGAQVLHHHDRR